MKNQIGVVTNVPNTHRKPGSSDTWVHVRVRDDLGEVDLLFLEATFTAAKLVAKQQAEDVPKSVPCKECVQAPRAWGLSALGLILFGVVLGLGIAHIVVSVR